MAHHAGPRGSVRQSALVRTAREADIGSRDDNEPWFQIAEIGPDSVGALIISDHPTPYIPAASEPDLYIDLLLVSRCCTGRRIGSALLDYARPECRNLGRTLLRVDCWAGGNRELVGTTKGRSFTPTEAFHQGDWPGQLLVQRLP